MTFTLSRIKLCKNDLARRPLQSDCCYKSFVDPCDKIPMCEVRFLICGNGVRLIANNEALNGELALQGLRNSQSGNLAPSTTFPLKNSEAEGTWPS